MGKRTTIRIEATSKKWKLCMMVGWLMFGVSLMTIFVADDAGAKALSVMGLVFGAIIYVLGRFLAWWNHG